MAWKIFKSLFLTVLLSCPAWGAFTTLHTITIPAAQVAANQTNFTFTLILNATDFKTTGNGGSVTSASGFDICIFSDPALTQFLKWAQAGPYSASAGTVVYRVLAPSLSASVANTFYIGVGNASITTFQGGTNAWDSSTGVYWLGASPNSSTLDLTDATGQIAAGTNHSATWTASGPPTGTGAGAFVAASSQYVNFGNPSSIRYTTTQTVSAWVNSTSTANKTIMENQYIGSTFNGGLTIIYNATGGAGFLDTTAGNGASIAQPNWSGGALNDSAWHNVVITMTGGQGRAYVDGVQTGSNQALFATLVFASATPFNIGATQQPNNFMQGSISDVRVDGVARDANWITTNYNSQHAPSTFAAVSGVTEAFTATPPTSATNWPTSYSLNLTMAGGGTNWSGTPFSATVAGNAVAITSQTVSGISAAMITVNTGAFTGQLVISDGVTTANGPFIIDPGFVATYGGPWHYNDFHGGATSFGDTWFLFDTVNGHRGTCNDCSCFGNSCAQNVALLNWNADLTTPSINNKLTGLGASATPSIGVCDSSHTVKSRGMISFAGLYQMFLGCSSGQQTNNVTQQLSTSGDDGSLWYRVQDSFAVSAGSWSSGTATLTTAAQTLTTGQNVIVMGCNPATYNSLPNSVVLTGTTTSTTINYAIASNPGTYVSGCTVVGPGAANATPPTVSMWTGSGRCQQRWFVQYCTDNVGCTATPDSSSTYLNGYCVTGNASGYNADLVAFHVLKSDVMANPGDATKYQYYSSATGWGAIGSATNPTCFVNGISQTCTQGGSVIYVTDSALPTGGMYLMFTGSSRVNSTASMLEGSLQMWASQSILSNTWTLLNTEDIDTNLSPPTCKNFMGSAPSLYTNISTNPYIGQICMQYGGASKGAGSDYSVSHKCALITPHSIQDSPIFNSNPIKGVAGYGSRYHHIQNGLVALWRMTAKGDVSTLGDDSVSGLNIALSAANTDPKQALIELDGLHNTDSSLNSAWAANGGAWKVATGFGQNLGDFTVLFVGKSPLTAAAETAMGGSQTSNTNGFIFKAASTPSMTFSVLAGGAGGGSITATAPVANTEFAYICGRKGTTGFCFKSGTSAPVTATFGTTGLGTWNLELGSEADGTPNFWTGSIGLIGIWNRALCSTQIPGTCSAGQVDEVLAEFGIVHTESVTRGWGL